MAAMLVDTAELSVEPIREALWMGRQIAYRPGLLHVALRRGVCHKMAYDTLIKAGCRIDYDSFRDGVFEVAVPPKDTLRLAVTLVTSPMFRYVEPDTLESQNKENFH